MMISTSILEAFWGPGLLTFCCLVAPVPNAIITFEGKFPSQILCVKSVLGSRKGAVKVGGWWRSAAGAEPAEGGRLRLRALKGFVSHV